MKKLFTVFLLWFLAASAWSADLGIRTSSETVRMMLNEAIDASGVPQAPDSMHLVTWRSDESGEVSYSGRSTTYPFAALYVDTTVVYGDTSYALEVLISDVDGTGCSSCELVISVKLFTAGLPTQTTGYVQLIPEALAFPGNFALLGITAGGYASINLDGTTGTLSSTEVPNLDVAVSTRGTSTLTSADNIGINLADVTGQGTTLSLTGTTIANVSGNVGGVLAIANEAISAGALSGAAVKKHLDSLFARPLFATLLTRVDEAISGIDDNPWDNPTRTLTALEESNTTIDLNSTIVGGLTTWDKIGYTLTENERHLVADTAYRYFTYSTNENPFKATGFSTLVASDIRTALEAKGALLWNLAAYQGLLENGSHIVLWPIGSTPKDSLGSYDGSGTLQAVFPFKHNVLPTVLDTIGFYLR